MFALLNHFFFKDRLSNKKKLTTICYYLDTFNSGDEFGECVVVGFGEWVVLGFGEWVVVGF